MKPHAKTTRTPLALLALLAWGLTATSAVAQDAPAKPDEPTVAEEPSPTDAGRKTALVSTMVLKVINPTETRAALEEEIAAIGGYPVLITDDSLTLKVPPDRLSEVLQQISDKGLVLEKSIERQDLTESIAQLEGRLKSKRAILTRLRGFFDDSNVQATLRIEQTMTDLVAEIEQVKGELRVLGERSRWAVVDIAFQFKRRDRIVYVHSPFEWLNTVNLDRFLEDF